MHGQRAAPRLHRAQGQAAADRLLKFRDNDDSVHAIIERIVAPFGRRIDESQPYGGRAPARRLARERHHPAAVADPAPSISIRKFSKDPFTRRPT
jgi:Flp pilus assembly CpaF family ATPase